MMLKIVLNKICNFIYNKYCDLLEFINLKKSIKSLKEQLEESKSNLEKSKLKERPYIDKINALKSEVRLLKMQNKELNKKLGEKNEKDIKF